MEATFEDLEEENSLEMSLKNDYVASQCFAMLSAQDGDNLRSLYETWWPRYASENLECGEDMNRNVFAVMCYRFLVKLNSKLALSGFDQFFANHSTLVPYFAAHAFQMVRRVVFDIVRNQHCSTQYKCRQCFQLLRQLVDPFIQKAMFWTPQDYVELRLMVLQVLRNHFGPRILPSQYKSLDRFLRSLAKYYYSYCTEHVKAILLPSDQ
ncbi:hypothetical protein M8J77_014446 [Diaphorina citri]|nr:hypothetical protein M8J77_014446 [Diaphorina citri]